MIRAANDYLYCILVIYDHLCATHLIPDMYYHLCYFYSYLSITRLVSQVVIKKNI